MMLMKTFRPAAALVWLLAITFECASAERIFTLATGAQEGHAGVKTSTTAELFLDIDTGATKASFTLNVFKGVNITQAHLHCGAAGVEGPVIAFLFGPKPKGVNVEKGTLSKGSLKNADILSNLTDFKNTAVCGVTIVNIVSLYAAIRKELVYVNVHTVANPGGEVRGQLYAPVTCNK